MRGAGVFSRNIGPGTGEPRRAHESLNGPIVVANDVLFWFFYIFFYLFWYFQLKFSILRKASFCPRDPKAVLFRPAKYFFDVQTIKMTTQYVLDTPLRKQTQITYKRHKTVYQYYEKKNTEQSSISKCYEKKPTEIRAELDNNFILFSKPMLLRLPSAKRHFQHT